MTTAYVLTDTTPKDAGGAKFAAMVDVGTSQGDFALYKGIAGSSPGTPARRLAHLAVGTHTMGSAIESDHPFVAIGGPHIENIGGATPTSPTVSGSGQIVAVTNWNELHVRGAPLVASQVSTSANEVKSSSGIVFGITVAVSSASIGDVIRVRDDTTDMFTYVAASEYDSYSFGIPDGGVIFSTSIDHAQTITDSDDRGAASVTILYR